MDKKAFAAAQDKLRAARSKYEAMRGASDLGALSSLWSEFLTEVHRVYSRLIKATEVGVSKGWSDGVKNERKTDDMLCYVHQARHADEHGIEQITNPKPASLTIGDPGEYTHIDHLSFDGKGNVFGRVTSGTVRWHP